MIKAIIFDVWGTIATKPDPILKTLGNRFDIKESESKFLEKYERSIQLQKWDSNEEMATSLLNAFNIQINKENIEFVINLHKNAGKNAKFIEGMDDCIRFLKTKYKLFILSNTVELEFKKASSNLGFDKLFDKIFCSYDLNVIKPDIKIYQKVIQGIKLDTEELLYIDDAEKNVNAAKILGMNVIRFQNPEQLKKELNSLGIIFN